MGNGKRRRRKLSELGRRQDWVDTTPEVEGNPGLWINSAPRTAEDVANGLPARCLITWGPLELYADVEDVTTTAQDLMTTATYADLIGELLSKDFEPHVILGMISSMLPDAMGGRRPVMGGMLGTDRTIGVMPAGSSERRAGVVMLKRGDQGGSLSPDGARAMATHWYEAALAARHDELVGMALEDILGAGDVEKLNGFLGYMASMRSLGANNLETFRTEEGARLRLLLEM
jgi:hypothetical protein